MKILVFILVLAGTVSAQSPNWKMIKEVSGPIQGSPGITVEICAAEVSRGDDIIKLLIKMEFPNGSPYELLKSAVPRGVDPSSIVRVEGRLELNCKTMTVKPKGSTAEVYLLNGKRYKSKEVPFKLSDGHLFAGYFCEFGEAPTTAPKLKP